MAGGACRQRFQKWPTFNNEVGSCLIQVFVLFVFHHKEISKSFNMVEVLMRPKCATAMLLVEEPA